ncbi:aminoacyl-tRNA hydrolase [Chloroflexota bacterium]
MKLIAGLGNPGLTYAHNRHNIGFMCISHLARTHGIKLDKKQGLARTGTGELAGEQVVLARPQTYMNASGDAVSRLVKKLHITPADLIVIHDDLDLPAGKIRLRFGGNSGGHKGVDSIIARLNSRDFYRVKVGIGRPVIPKGFTADREGAIIDYVLSDFTGEEREIITKIIPDVGQAILCLLTEGFTAAMNTHN